MPHLAQASDTPPHFSYAIFHELAAAGGPHITIAAISLLGSVVERLLAAVLLFAAPSFEPPARFRRRAAISALALAKIVISSISILITLAYSIAGAATPCSSLTAHEYHAPVRMSRATATYFNAPRISASVPIFRKDKRRRQPCQNYLTHYVKMKMMLIPMEYARFRRSPRH